MSIKQPVAERDYYSDPRRRAKSLAVRMASRLARPLGVDVELRHWYSPVPQLDEIDESFWNRPDPMCGVRPFDTAAMLEYAEAELADSISEFGPPREWSGHSNEFFLDNGLFQGVDADVLYAMVRRYRPSRVIELGAGFSTLVTSMAAEANRAEGHMTALISCDPYAVAPLPGEVPGLAELRPIRAQDFPFEEVEALQANDILFIDSSHTVRIGGDVTFIFNELIPRLAPGVLVHIHDVFLPWPYPREWIARNRWYWSEQYLLQSFLTFNERYEVLWASYAVHRQQPIPLGRLIPNYRATAAPLSLWMRSIEPDVDRPT